MDAPGILSSFSVSRASTTPLYQQLYEFLSLQVRLGTLQPGDRMPTEEEMCDALGVSRSTARQALALLVDKGVVERFRGKGTFVAQPASYHRPMSHLYNFSADMEEAGRVPSSRTVVQEVVTADAGERSTLELVAPQAQVFRLCRVRQADGAPVLYEDTRLPLALCPGIQDLSFDDASLYAALRDDYGLEPASAVETMRGVLLPDDVCGLLGCPSGTVGYRIERVARLSSNVVYEHTQSYARADLVAYRFELGNLGAGANGARMTLAGT